MKYPPINKNASKRIDVESVLIPYFYKNKEWYYHNKIGVKLTDKAPKKARESYRVYMGYYDEKEDANVYGYVPEELGIDFASFLKE
jgi:hypothetical protein